MWSLNKHHDVSLTTLTQTILLWVLMSQDVFVLLFVLIHSSIEHNVRLRSSVPGKAIGDDSNDQCLESTSCTMTAPSQLQRRLIHVTRAIGRTYPSPTTLGRTLVISILLKSQIMVKKISRMLGSACLAVLLRLWQTLSRFQLLSPHEPDFSFRLKVSKKMEPDWLRKDALYRSATADARTRYPGQVINRVFGAPSKRGIIRNTIAIPVQQMPIRLWKQEQERSRSDRYPVKMRPLCTGSSLARQAEIDATSYRPSFDNFLAQGWLKGVDRQNKEEMNCRGRDRGRQRALGRRSFDSSPQARSCLAAGLGLSSRRLGQTSINAEDEDGEDQDDYTPPIPTIPHHLRPATFSYIPSSLSIPFQTPLLISAAS